MLKNYFFYLFILSYTTHGICSEKSTKSLSQALGSLHQALNHTVQQQKNGTNKTTRCEIQHVQNQNKVKTRPYKKQSLTTEVTVLKMLMALGGECLSFSDKQLKNQNEEEVIMNEAYNLFKSLRSNH